VAAGSIACCGWTVPSRQVLPAHRSINGEGSAIGHRHAGAGARYGIESNVDGQSCA